MNSVDTNGYSARLIVKHPNLNLSSLTSELNAVPLRCWHASDEVKTIKGESVGGLYGYSMWTCKFINADIDVQEAIDHIVRKLESASDKIGEIVSTGGSVQVVVDFSGRKNTGASLDQTILRRLADVGASLGLEVFP